MVVQATKRFDAEGEGVSTGFTNFGGATKMASILTDDSTTSYISSNSAGAATQTFDIDVTFPEKMAHINAVRVICRHQRDAGSNSNNNTIGVRLYETNTMDAAFIAVGAWTTETSVSLARPTGGDWTEADFRLTGVDRFQFRIVTGAHVPDTFVTLFYVEVDYIPLNQVINLEREVASRRLWLNREPEEEIKLIGNWAHLEAELMDPVAFSHPFGPTYDAKGWGDANWERGFGILKKQRISLSMSNVQSIIRNSRRTQTTYWEIFKATIAGDPDIADGIPRLDSAGADREFIRTSSAWIEEVDGTIKLLTASKEKLESKGVLIESAATNLVLESSFVNGVTGWTKTDTTGVTAFATNTDNLLFDTAVTAQSVALTVSTAPYDSDIAPTAAPVLVASTAYTLSVDWETTSTGSATTEVAIQNATTANWLQSDGGSWGASRVNITLGTEVGTKQRDSIEFTTEGTGTTHNVHVNFTGSTDLTVHNVYHVQIETGQWASSRIVTETVAVTRAVDSLLIRNDSTLPQRIFPIDRFTIKIRFTPSWNSVDLVGSDIHTLLQLVHDASNYIYIVYANASDAVLVAYVHAGTLEAAWAIAPGFVAGTEYEVVVRRTTTAGELNETNNTMSLFLDGVKGGFTDIIAADLTEAATSVMQIGSLSDNTLPIDGWIGEIMISPIVFSDIEIAGGI